MSGVEGIALPGTLGNSPSTNISCADEVCQAWLDAQNEYLVSWTYQFQYGHWTSYYYVGIMEALSLIYIILPSWIEKQR